MTYKKIDPADLDQHIGRHVTIISDYGWDMNDWPTWGVLRGVEDGYFYVEPDDLGEDEYDDFHDLGGSAVHCITSVQVHF